jgi:hypothetical protein
MYVDIWNAFFDEWNENFAFLQHPKKARSEFLSFSFAENLDKEGEQNLKLFCWKELYWPFS